jgi:hypothetical protein
VSTEALLLPFASISADYGRLLGLAVGKEIDRLQSEIEELRDEVRSLQRTLDARTEHLA